MKDEFDVRKITLLSTVVMSIRLVSSNSVNFSFSLFTHCDQFAKVDVLSNSSSEVAGSSFWLKDFVPRYATILYT